MSPSVSLSVLCQAIQVSHFNDTAEVL